MRHGYLQVKGVADDGGAAVGVDAAARESGGVAPGAHPVGDRAVEGDAGRWGRERGGRE